MGIHWWLFPLMGSVLILVILAILAGVVKRWQARRPTPTGEQSSDQLDSHARELIHEIRNPLNSVNLNLQLIEEDLTSVESPGTDEVLNRVRRIRSEIERLNQILTDYRRFTGLPPLSFQQCDPSLLIEEVLEFTEPEAQSRSIEVVREIQELPSIKLDPDQFKQALWNLIINATQAMSNGGRLTLRASASGGNVQVDVQDTGKGISSDTAGKDV